MGSGGSKAAARSYDAAKTVVSKVAVDQTLSGSVAVDAARAAQQAKLQALTLEQEEQLESKDQMLGGFLDQLGGAIQGKAIHITPSKEQLQQQHVAVLPDSSGRLPSDALKELLELQRAAAGGPLDASHLIHKYNVSPELIQRVLARVCLPEVVEAAGPEGVKAFADYPAWFQRRS